MTDERLQGSPNRLSVFFGSRSHGLVGPSLVKFQTVNLFYNKSDDIVRYDSRDLKEYSLLRRIVLVYLFSKRCLFYSAVSGK